MLEISSLSKAYGSTVALDKLTLTVRRDELLVLLGPSGCGKTTLLRLIAGHEKAGAGRIVLDSRDVTEDPPETRGIGMVFQNYALFPHLTAAANVEFGLKMRGETKATRRRRASDWLAFVGLGGMEYRDPASLSGGEQQRVALARALAIEPKVLLLDEPFANLDRPLRDQMRTELRALQQRLGITTLFVTHDQDEALLLADRIAVMNRGQIHQCATPLHLCLRPATEFVAAFFGR